MGRGLVCPRSGIFVIGTMGLATWSHRYAVISTLNHDRKIALEANPQTSWIAYLLGPAEPATADAATQDAANDDQPPQPIHEPVSTTQHTAHARLPLGRTARG